jgi:hypothetical protein
MRLMKVEDDAKLDVVCTPGMQVGTTVFEQVKGHQYALYDVDKQTIVLRDDLADSQRIYQPLQKVPWPLCTRPVAYIDKEQLWSDVRQFIWDHLFLIDEALYDVLTAWVFASWIPEVWPVVPYVFFYGPVASGKTRSLEVLHRLCYRSILSSNISSAALFRACEAWHPTIILDETEIYSKADRSDVIGLLNSGYRRGQHAIRARSTDHGVELDVFDVFGFKALAGTRGLKATLESRSIMVRTIKNRRKVRLFIDEARAHALRSQLLMWRLDTLTLQWRDKAEWKRLVTQNDENGVAGVLDGFLEAVPPLDVESGRLQELFQCLVAVANRGRGSIMKYAKKIEEIQALEEKASIEAELVEIILNSNVSLENNVVLTSELAEAFNKSRCEREKWKTSSIGWKMRGLGFTSKKTGQGRGWVVDLDRLRYLKEIYVGDLPPAGKTPKPPQPPQAPPLLQESRDAPAFVCWLCQKPLPADRFDCTTAEGKPCHIACYKKLQQGRQDPPTSGEGDAM